MARTYRKENYKQAKLEKEERRKIRKEQRKKQKKYMKEQLCLDEIDSTSDS
tara:strand:+ start:262 stop:414 length:153 start_codon:yes stop_codon:yes gene_type:complete